MLADGSVLVVGGTNDTSLALGSAEVYLPATQAGLDVSTYDTASGVLNIPSIKVGNDIYANVSLRLTDAGTQTFVLTGATRQPSAVNAVATYDTGTGMLMIPFLQAGASAYASVTMQNTGNYVFVLRSAQVQ